VSLRVDHDISLLMMDSSTTSHFHLSANVVSLMYTGVNVREGGVDKRNEPSITLRKSRMTSAVSKWSVNVILGFLAESPSGRASPSTELYMK
jgi:hypothetical protein